MIGSSSSSLPLLSLARNLNSSSPRLIRTCNRQRTRQQQMPRSVTKKNLPSTESKSRVSLSTSVAPPTLMAQVVNDANHPSSKQLKAIFIASAIPMVAFGFMDNLIMIQAGGYIDATFGATLGLATLSAAALGQVFSDVSGVAFGGVVERTLHRFHLTKSPSLTNTQRNLPMVRNVRMAGAIIGVAAGCLLGATSLFFMDLEARERRERTAALKDIITKMLLASTEDDGLQCEECRIHLVSASREIFDSSLSLPNIDAGSSSSSCTLTVQQLKPFNNNKFGDDEQSLPPQELCARDAICISKNNSFYVPIVMNKKNNTLGGVLEFRSNISGFTMDDKRTAQILARHIGIFMERLAQESYD